MRALAFVLAAFVLLAGGGRASAEGDPANGEKLFRPCRSCHAIGPGAKTKAGPTLNGIVGRLWADDPDFAYSQAMSEGRAAGERWSVEALTRYLAGPRAFLPQGKKSLAGIKKPENIADIIAFMATFNANGSTK